jgi:hypothetical protein
LRPSSGSLFSASTNNTHTEYQIVLENFRTGQLWQVERRFNDFASFRENVEKIFQAPHCHYCAHIKQQIHDLGVLFPPKKLWGSMRKSVIKYRAHQFFHYLNELLRLATEQYALNCRMVSVSLTSHVRQFLTNESTRYNGIPGTTNTGKEIPCMLRELSQDRIALATINEGICSSLCEDFEGEETYWKIHLHDDEENQTEPEIDDSSRGSSEEREEQEQNPAEEIIFFSF